MDDGNGIPASTAQNPRGVQRLTIMVHNETGKMDVDIDARSLDEALSILHRAAVQLEARVKFECGKGFMQEAAENARIAQIASRAMQRGPQRV